MFEMFEHFFTVFGFISFWIIISAWIIAATHKVTKKPYPEKDSIFTPEILTPNEHRASIHQIHPFDQTKH